MGTQLNVKEIKTKMASTKGVQVLRQVKPLMSIDNHEARLRVLALYKAWIRQVPAILKMYDDMPVTEKACKDTIKNNFVKNKNLKDIRVIDMMVIKGQQDLREVIECWAQSGHLMSKYFKETIEERPKDFMSKFLSGRD